MAEQQPGGSRRSRQALQEPPESLAALPLTTPDGPLWYREHKLRLKGDGSESVLSGAALQVFQQTMRVSPVKELEPLRAALATYLGPRTEGDAGVSRTDPVLGDLIYIFQRDGGCWFFASVPDDAASGGRFDLSTPEGTCYFADSEQGAAMERVGRFTAARKPVPRDLVENRVVTSVETSLLPQAQVGDLLSPEAATVCGVTTELFTVDDYPLCQRWAAQARADGYEALLYRPRFSPNSRALAVFGPTGEAQRPALLHHKLPAVLAEIGVPVSPIPTMSETTIIEPD